MAAEYDFHYDPPSVRDCDSEIAIQMAMLRRIAMQFRHTMAYAVPNGTHIVSKAARGKAMREGRKKGASDLVILGSPRLTAIVEVKAKESLTSDQREFLETCAAMGHHCGCFRSQDTLAAKLIEWGFR